MNKTILILSLILSANYAYAEINEPEVYSRGFQQAKRVASVENRTEIPSRALELGSRVAKKSRELALETSETKGAPQKPSKKTTALNKNKL